MSDQLNKVAIDFPRFDSDEYDPVKMRDLVRSLERWLSAYNSNEPVAGWEDLTADISAGRGVGPNAPSWATFRNGISAYEFSASTMNEVWVNFHVKHDYAEQTTVYPHMHWAPDTTSTGTVRWGFEYSVARGHDQEPFPATTTVYAESTISSAKQYQHIISEVSDNDSFDALETDSLILMRVFRDAAHPNDTFPDTVFGFTADIHYQADHQFTELKAPPFFSLRR